MTTNINNSQRVIYLQGETIPTVPILMVLSPESKIMKNISNRIIKIEKDINFLRSHKRDYSMYRKICVIEKIQFSIDHVKKIFNLIKSAGAIALEAEFEVLGFEKTLDRMINRL
ncbi:MAG TPA: hypothetical protein VGP47_07230 [Parachlamydiaceae bacterium]|nr:hypothetical protein [Parachlamydiaceae bacterium]